MHCTNYHAAWTYVQAHQFQQQCDALRVDLEELFQVTKPPFKSAIIAAFVLLATACGSPSDSGTDDGTIKIGAPVSLSGTYAVSGKGLKDTFNMWADWVNEKGGLQVGDTKRKVKVIFADDRSDPNTTLQLTENFINKDKVDFMFGPFSSDLTMGASGVSNRANVIMMAGGSSGSEVFSRGFKNIFTTWAPTTYWARSTIDALAEQGLKRIAILASREGAYAVMPDEAKDYAESKGIKVVSLQQVTQDTADVSGPMLQIKKSNPQLFMVMTNSIPLEGLVASTARTLDFSPDWYWTANASLDADVEAYRSKNDLETLMAPVPFQPSPKLKGKHFTSEGWLKQYSDEYGPPTTTSTPTSFAGAIILGEAIEKAGSVDTDEVRKVLESTEFDTFMGKIKFSSLDDPSGLGHMALSRPIPTVQWQDGKLVLIAPSEEAEVDPVKFKPWK